MSPQSSSLQPLVSNTCQILRAAPVVPGRSLLASPENSRLQRLRYGRIVGTPTAGTLQFTTGQGQTVLIGRRGLGFVLVDDELYEINPLDCLTVPSCTQVQIHADGVGCELIEVVASEDLPFPIALASLEDSTAGTPGLEVQLNRGDATLGCNSAERMGIWLDPATLRVATADREGEMSIGADDCLLLPGVELRIASFQAARWLLLTVAAEPRVG